MINKLFTDCVYLSEPTSNQRKEWIKQIIKYYNKESSYNQIDFTDISKALLYHGGETRKDKIEISKLIQSIEKGCKV